MSPFPGLTDALTPLFMVALTVTMMLLVFGAPVIIALSIRFLWYRHLYIGRSAELEKLIWQLHRIASALEHEKGLSFPAEQPGTEAHEREMPLSMFGR